MTRKAQDAVTEPGVSHSGPFSRRAVSSQTKTSRCALNAVGQRTSQFQLQVGVTDDTGRNSELEGVGGSGAR